MYHARTHSDTVPLTARRVHLKPGNSKISPAQSTQAASELTMQNKTSGHFWKIVIMGTNCSFSVNVYVNNPDCDWPE